MAKKTPYDNDDFDLNDDLADGGDTVDTSFMGSREEGAESRTIASRKRLREQMQQDIEAFLARGGKIQEVAANVLADPPTKPKTDYGSRPI